jgi:hypothetical protein
MKNIVSRRNFISTTSTLATGVFITPVMGLFPKIRTFCGLQTQGNTLFT